MDQLTSAIEEPNPVDRHVGLRIRMRRHQLQVSQERLATAIGVSFQQLQKYEKAANRVSASKLWEIGNFLSVPTAFFFEGLDEPTTSPSNWARDFLSLPEGLDIAETFPRIRVARVRRQLATLIRTIAYVSMGDVAGQASDPDLAHGPNHIDTEPPFEASAREPASDHQVVASSERTPQDVGSAIGQWDPRIG